MPSDRYASAARFGADLVKAVSGMAEVAPVVDVDGATQLIDATEITDQSGDLGGATEAMPSTRAAAQDRPGPTPDTPMPPTAVASAGAAEVGKRKKPPVAAIAAVVGALAIGGGGAVMLVGGGEPEAAPGDSLGQKTQDPVTQNTETVSETGEGSPSERIGTPPGGQQRPARGDVDIAAADSGRETRSIGTEDSATTTPARANPPWMSLAGAEDHLIDLFISLDGASSQTVEAVRDTAVFYYDAVGIDDVNRALAAFVGATAYNQLGDRSTALDWIRRSLALNPDDDAAQTLLQALQRGGNL
jgi:hypothetical protein